MKEFLEWLEIVSYIFFIVFVCIMLGIYVAALQGQGSITGDVAFLFGLFLLLSLIGFIFLCFRITKFIFVKREK